jgi:hypothetical protein
MSLQVFAGVKEPLTIYVTTDVFAEGEFCWSRIFQESAVVTLRVSSYKSDTMAV